MPKTKYHVYVIVSSRHDLALTDLNYQEGIEFASTLPDNTEINSHSSVELFIFCKPMTPHEYADVILEHFL